MTTNSIAEYGELFATHRHLVLSELLADPWRSVVEQYAVKRALHTPETSWGSVIRGTPAFYGDPLAETLLELFEGTAAQLAGLELDLTFAELFVYGRSAAINPTRARDAAEVRLTVFVGGGSDEPWPLLVDLDGETVSVELKPGDALLHQPSSDAIRREPLANGYAVELQLNYVDRNGPNAGLRFDGRTELGELPSVRDLPVAASPRRRHGFVHEVFDQEILVHYPGDDIAISLNLEAALVWAQCDGESSPSQIAERLAAAYPEAADRLPAEVVSTIDELRSVGALDG